MARVPLRIEHGSVYLSATVLCRTAPRPKPLKFLVDTGASVTILSLRDAKEIGVDPSTLPRHPVPVGGYGGKAEMRRVDGVMLSMSREDGTNHEIVMDYIGVHCAGAEAKREERLVYGIPSIIGTDAMRESGLWLHMNLAKNVAYFED